MDEKDYLSKIAISKDNKILGKITRVEGSPSTVIISQKPHVVIEAKRILFSSDYIQLPLTSVVEIFETEIQFDITKDDFTLKRRAYRADKKNQINENTKRKNKDKDFNKDVDNAVAKQRPWM